MPANTRIKDFRVAVTGGTSGLGLALVRLLTGRGARVAFVARTASAVEFTANGTGAFGIIGDVGRKSDIYPIALQIIGNLGGLDVLINNASSLGPTPLAPLADTECEELEQALAVNVLGPFRLTAAVGSNVWFPTLIGHQHALWLMSEDDPKRSSRCAVNEVGWQATARALPP